MSTAENMDESMGIYTLATSLVQRVFTTWQWTPSGHASWLTVDKEAIVQERAKDAYLHD